MVFIAQQQLEFSSKNLTLYSLGDSLAVTQMFNPKVNIKKIYLRDAMIECREACLSICENFPDITIKFGSVKGTDNSVDCLTKFMPNPVSIINHKFYRYDLECLVSADLSKEFK